MAEVRRLRLTPPAPYGDADRAGAFRRKLKPARGRHGEPRDFGDDGAEPPMTQSFLETGQHGLLIGRLDIDHPVGRQPGLSEGRREEILAGDAPKHLAARPGGNSRGEQRRRRAVDRAIAAASHLMQGAERQSPVWPKVNTARRRVAAPSRRWIRSRSSSTIGVATDVAMSLSAH